MKIHTKTPLLALALIAGMSPAYAEEVASAGPAGLIPTNGRDLRDLLKDCDTETCFSYVSGAINGIGVYAYLAGNASPFCTAENVRSGDIRTAIIDAVNSAPALEDAPAAIAILTAFSRNWPCAETTATPTDEVVAPAEPEQDVLHFTDLKPIDFDAMEAFVDANTSSLTLGNPEAGVGRTLYVFDDPNCEYCDKFRTETDALLDAGWKIVIVPVSVVSDDSKGFAAVSYAIRDRSPAAAEALYRHDTTQAADITSAMQIAEEAGMPAKDILEAIAMQNAYAAIDINNTFFKDSGAEGTPAWILADRLYSGLLAADEITRLSSEVTGPDGQPVTVRPGLAPAPVTAPVQEVTTPTEDDGE